MTAPKPLRYSIDSYMSAIISDECCTKPPSKEAPDTPEAAVEFESRLFASLKEFKAKRCRGVWLQLPRERADLIPPAIRCGFNFHSARHDQITLTAWLPEEEESRLPPGAAHFIGVGCFVVNSKEELLVVREKTGPSARLPDFWKLPGGLTDRQENFHDAAVRECFEETGLKTEFVCVSAIQEVHHSEERAGPARSGTTDLYVVCILKAVDENQPLVPCEKEIAEARWMKASEFLALPFYSALGSVFSHLMNHSFEVAKGRAPGMRVSKMKMGFLPAYNSVYFSTTTLPPPESKL